MKIWHDSCEEVLARKRVQHTKWVSVDTPEKLQVRKATLNISQTRAVKSLAQQEYSTADKEVKKKA